MKLKNNTMHLIRNENSSGNREIESFIKYKIIHYYKISIISKDCIMVLIQLILLHAIFSFLWLFNKLPHTQWLKIISIY